MKRETTATKAIAELRALRKPTRAHDMQRFFKTAPGEYGEGDIFLGLTVPQVRIVAKDYCDLELSEIEKLSASQFHEIRLCGLIILSNQFKATTDLKIKKSIFNFYMKQMKLGRVNNWDLVDVSAPTIGEYLVEVADPLPVLRKLARSNSLWERRIAVLFTFAFIRVGDFAPTMEISERLLGDSHDLIHKAVGWLLREVGKRDPFLLRSFLDAHAHEMPRTMLRYSIEKLPESERQKWLKKTR
jgi:3-methyladenine DNA glycosylase AlkD